MNPHFFTAPFTLLIWFRVQGSGGGFAWVYTDDDTRSPFFLPPSFGRRC